MDGNRKIFKSLTVCAALAVAFILFFSSGVALAVPKEDLEPLPADLPQGTEIICTASSINLREEPVVDSDNVLTVVREDDVLIFQNWVDDTEWVYVKFGDILGYCSSKYLAYDPNAPTPTPSPSPSPTATPSVTPEPVATPSPTPEPVVNAAPESTPKEAPPPITTSYENQWQNKSIGEKLSRIPIWLFGVAVLGLLIIVVYRLSTKRRKK
jgi:hypothetical protein